MGIANYVYGKHEFCPADIKSIYLVILLSKFGQIYCSICFIQCHLQMKCIKRYIKRLEYESHVMYFIER